MTTLFGDGLSLVNMGNRTFAREAAAQGATATSIDWRPPAGGNPALVRALDALQDDPRVDEANEIAVNRFMDAHPMLVDIARAIDVVPGMTPTTILHAGPPIAYSEMPEPMKGAVIGAIMYEGLATTPEDADALAASGDITFAPAHDHDAVGAMTGVFSARMTVHVVKNTTDGNLAYCPVHEGSGYRVQRYGSWDPDVLERLHWLDDEYRPAITEALRILGGVDVRSTVAQALHMADELHNRNKASSVLLYRTLMPALLDSGLDKAAIKRVSEFINANEHYHLSVTMASSKACLDAAHGVPNATIVTAMARNGKDFGIKVSGLPKDAWFTGAAQMIDGLYFPGYSMADANPDMGDSAISETSGLGGFSLGGAPAIVQFIGGTVADGLEYVRRMYEITWTEHKHYSIPNLNFRGTPAGIDLRKVLQSGVLPVITTGIASKERGRGQIGAGLTNPPMECFASALQAFSTANS